jgi:hypothetical protein
MNMNADTKALAEKVARGKGLNAEDRDLMQKIALAGGKDLTEYANMVVELGKKTEHLTFDLIQGSGRFGLYLKVNVPGSYKSLNMGKAKFQRFLLGVKDIGYETIIKAFDDGKPAHWEIDMNSK